MTLSPIKAICDKAESWLLSSLPSAKISLVEIFQPLYLAAAVSTQHGGELRCWGRQRGSSSPPALFIGSAVKSLNPLGIKSCLAETTFNTAQGGDSFSNCVHPYRLLGNFSITCRSVIPPKSPSLPMSMAGGLPTCPSTAFDPPRRGEETAGQHLVLCRFSG